MKRMNAASLALPTLIPLADVITSYRVSNFADALLTCC